MYRNVARKIYLLPVKAYQKFLSPFIGRDCIYCPTCSNYFTECVMKFGIIKGTILGTCRILRCNRLFFGGPDPVPETFSFREIRSRHIAFRRHGRDIFR